MKTASRIIASFGLAILASHLFPVPSHADSHSSFSFDDIDLLDDIGDAFEDMAEDFSLRLGAGVAVAPAYLGDDSYKARIYPHLKLQWRDLIVLKNTKLRIAVIRNGTFRAGPQFKYRFGRGVDKRPDLVGLDPVGDSFEIGGFFEWYPGYMVVGADFAKDVADGHEGTRASVWAGSRKTFGDAWTAILGARLTWASGAYMNAHFGVDEQESVFSGLPTFDAGSGFRDIAMRVGLRYDLRESWRFDLSVIYARLLDDAANNPLVEERGDPNQLATLLSAQYRF